MGMYMDKLPALLLGIVGGLSFLFGIGYCFVFVFVLHLFNF
jgi:hypothetical protein